MLEDIKLLLGIGDELQDKLLTFIIKDSEERILASINQYSKKNNGENYNSIPEELLYIQRDVAIKRFNKMNSEGVVSDSEEGRSFTWEKSYLDEYLDLFENFTKPEIMSSKGIARFY